MKEGITNKAPVSTMTSSNAITASAPPPSVSQPGRTEGDGARSPRKQVHPLWRLLEIIASLRITVVLFALSIVLVFYGTWAQVDQGVWTAVDRYFRSALVWIPIRVLSMHLIDSKAVVPYPGGWLLGGLLLANLLAAHTVRFRFTWKCSGILMIHAGLIVMMLSELFTGLFAVEGRMRILEGQTVNFVAYEREPEIAVIDSSLEQEDVVVAIPTGMLRTGASIQHEDLPFDVQIDKFMVNSKLTRPDPKNNPATKGIGLEWAVEERPETSGTDSEQSIDVSSAYVTLRDKKTGDSLGKYLLSYHFFPFFLEKTSPELVQVDGKKYEIILRPRFSYRDFQIKLDKFRHDRHPGTGKAKNFQSDIQLIQDGRAEPRTISMNNPLRHEGETFYQASFEPNDRGTVLQVVNNPVWTWPYISCIVVTLGMLIHFGLNLLSFLEKRVAQ